MSVLHTSCFFMLTITLYLSTGFGRGRAGVPALPLPFASRSHVACGLLVSGRGRSGAPLLPCGSKDALALGAISLPGLVAGKWGLHK